MKETQTKKRIIAIDGHSSCGKSTVAKDLAKQLHIAYIDSGAMYRCVTLYALQHNIIVDGAVNEEKLKKALNNISIDFRFNPETQTNQTYLDNILVEKEIRGMEVTNLVSTISTYGFVRKKLVELQQNMGEKESLVMDGRDIGTVVFPNAHLKIFMTTAPEIRAERRFKEFQEKGENISFEAVLKNIRERDHMDENRTESPLIKASDAVVLDNGNLSKEEQLQSIVQELQKRSLI